MKTNNVMKKALENGCFLCFYMLKKDNYSDFLRVGDTGSTIIEIADKSINCLLIRVL